MSSKSVIFMFIVAAAPLFGSCFLCEEIRERNRNTPPPEQEFYEDFLEAQRAEGKSPAGKIEFVEEGTSESEQPAE